jgi:hypothetical protein
MRPVGVPTLPPSDSIDRMFVRIRETRWPVSYETENSSSRGCVDVMVPTLRMIVVPTGFSIGPFR